jgi:hypothetical protein
MNKLLIYLAFLAATGVGAARYWYAPPPALTLQARQAMLAVIRETPREGDFSPSAQQRQIVTPERLVLLDQSNELVKLPLDLRINALAYAGQGELLDFTNPSDVIAKMRRWFPERDEQRWHLALPPPQPDWQAKPMAFVSLSNCMPGAVLDGKSPLTDTGDYNLKDFAACVHLLQFRDRDHREYPELGKKVTPALDRALLLLFADTLTRRRCEGKGPDDCVLILRQWSSLAPADPALAAAIRLLEHDASRDLDKEQLTPEEYARASTFLNVKLAALTANAASSPADTWQVLFAQIKQLNGKQHQESANKLDWEAMARKIPPAMLEQILLDRSGGAMHDQLLSALCGVAPITMLPAEGNKVCARWIEKVDDNVAGLASSAYEEDSLDIPGQAGGSAPDEKTWRAWLGKTLTRAGTTAPQDVSAFAALAAQAKVQVYGASLWMRRGADKQLLVLEVANEQDGKPAASPWPDTEGRVLLLLDAKSAKVVSVPFRYRYQYDLGRVRAVTDIDHDGKLELWFNGEWGECDGEPEEMQPGVNCAIETDYVGEIVGDTLTYFTSKDK